MRRNAIRRFDANMTLLHREIRGTRFHEIEPPSANEKSDSRMSSRGTGRRTGRRAWNANLISVTTATEATKDNGGRGRWLVVATGGSWIDLFKGVYSAEDTMAKRHDAMHRGREEEGERERERTRMRGRSVEHWVVPV